MQKLSEVTNKELDELKNMNDQFAKELESMLRFQSEI